MPPEKMEDMKRKSDILKGRQTILPCLTIYHIPAILAITLLVTTFPAFYSCTHASVSPDDVTDLRNKIYLKVKSDSSLTGDLDIFFFNADRLMRLDSYMRTDASGGWNIEAASREGKRIMAVIGNSPLTQNECSSILSYDDFKEMYAELVHENPESPVMYAECTVKAGHEATCEVELQPMMSRIAVNSICCDFHGKPYEGLKLEDVRIYLTDVCGRYRIAGDDGGQPESIINHGKLSDEDMAEFRNPSMLRMELDCAVGDNVVHPETALYCYPNLSEEYGLGTPFTKLVIEGTLDGKRTFYPIEVNRGDWKSASGKDGISRNRSYIYDITITRRGTSAPDIPISMHDAGCRLSIRPWNMAEDRIVEY